MLRAYRVASVARIPRHFSSAQRALSTANEPRSLTVLGVESSCDDSCIGVVRWPDRSILADERTSQFHVHQAYGGIVPILAVREHEVNLPLVLERAFQQVNRADIDLIAVTTGPGLKACLRAGMNQALKLGDELKKPVIGINHLEAHALVPRMGFPSIAFPFMTLLVSGGHTSLSISKAVGAHVELGSTLDDAMGEAFDKVIRGLEDPEACSKHGGAVLEALARKGQVNPDLKLPIALRGPTHKRPRGLDFSFSGLKSSTTRAIARKVFRAEDIALEFQRAAVEHVIHVVSDALEANSSVKQFVVSGGVASNGLLRSRLKAACNDRGVECFFPSTRLCVDNGVMAAWCGVERWLAAKGDSQRTALTIDRSEQPRARWALGDLRPHLHT
jgi:N6-L-threonylcarbamoyladenine synthase